MKAFMMMKTASFLRPACFFRLFVRGSSAWCFSAGPGRAGRYAFDLISLCPDLLVQTISGVIPLYFSSDLTS
jgi:hypothetical protein